MKNKAYILQPDIKAYFPNWDKMTKEEQQKWENEFEAMKRKMVDPRKIKMQG